MTGSWNLQALKRTMLKPETDNSDKDKGGEIQAQDLLPIFMGCTGKMNQTEEQASYCLCLTGTHNSQQITSILTLPRGLSHSLVAPDLKSMWQYRNGGGVVR